MNTDFSMLKEVASMIPVLGILIICNIISGTCKSLTVLKIKFDWEKMKLGLVKAVVAIICILVLCVVFGKFDLSSIGFTPSTIMSTGILVYTAKVANNLFGILGISNFVSYSFIPKAYDQEELQIAVKKVLEDDKAKGMDTTDSTLYEDVSKIETDADNESARTHA